MSATAAGITLITGGVGFVGANLAHHLLQAGERVRVFDNLSRPGVEKNLQWLRETHGPALEMQFGDVRDLPTLRSALHGVAHVFHFAAQVAVTTSLVDPFTDFEVNARGTLNVLQAIREQAAPPSLLFTSTNKVYGALDDLALHRRAARYEPEDAEIARFGISEKRRLQFHSPYGCSKGAADQYVLDYAHTFAIPAVVFRMSCIYGPRQFGNEDQGWVAHFLIRAASGEPITLYGDGRQARDILCVHDLVEAFLLARGRIGELSGHAFNIGGGPQNSVSLVELLQRIQRRTGRPPTVSLEPWRTADQRYYVSDVREFGARTGWKPRIGVDEGLQLLWNWVEQIVPSVPQQARPRQEAVS